MAYKGKVPWHAYKLKLRKAVTQNKSKKKLAENQKGKKKKKDMEEKMCSQAHE